MRGGGGDAGLLKKAIAGLQVTDVEPVVVTASPSAGGVQVKVTNHSPKPQDGVVELMPATGAAPAAQHFHSLASGESASFSFALPAKGAAGQVRVRAGDRQMKEVKTPYPGG